MPVGQPQPLMNIQPSELIGQPVGLGNAAEKMGEAFRRGLITADDVVKRADQRDALKKQIEIKALQKQLDPGRESLMSEFEDFKANAAAFANETKDEQLKTDEGIFSRYVAPGAEGEIPEEDYIKIRGAANRLETMTPEEWIRMGRPKSLPDYLRIKGTPLSFDKMAPGAVATEQAETTTAPASVEVKPTTQAAGFGNMGQVQVGQRVPGLGRKIVSVTPKGASGEAKAMASAAEDLNTIQNLRSQVQTAKGLIAQSGMVGPAAGSAPVRTANQIAAAFGIREDEYKGQRQLEMLVSQKVLEGAQKMKGNLSDKDIRFLQATVPKLTDTPELWKKYLDTWDKALTKSAEIIQGTAPAGTSVLTPEQEKAVTPPGPGTSTSSFAPPPQPPPQPTPQGTLIKYGGVSYLKQVDPATGKTRYLRQK